MTRYAPRRVDIGALGAVGSGQVQNIFDAIVTALTGLQFDGQAAWEVYDTVSATSIVLRSLGDRTAMGGRGDAGIYVHLIISGVNIRIRTYSDYSTVSSTGTRIAPSTASNNEAQCSDTEAAQIYVCANQYEFAFFVSFTSAPPSMGVAGQPRRVAIPPSQAGVTRLSAGVAASGAPVDLPVRSDMRNQIRPGQIIWGIDQTPEGDALLTEHVEAMTVSSDADAVGADYVRVTSVANTFAVDALIGLNPQPNAVGSSHGAGAGDRVYVSHRADASNVGNDRCLYNPGPVEQDANPLGEWGIVQLGRPFLYYVSGPFQLLGTWDSIAVFRDNPAGAVLTPFDLWYPHDNANGGWRLGPINDSTFRFANGHYYALYHGTT